MTNQFRISRERGNTVARFNVHLLRIGAALSVSREKKLDLFDRECRTANEGLEMAQCIRQSRALSF